MKIKCYISSGRAFTSVMVLFLIIVLFNCSLKAQTHETWSRNLNIYEVNTRQYTRAGTFNAFRTHLDRLKNMGVGIIWFMPVNPIGTKNRLGSLGSPYSVKDYLTVNPEFGTLNDFKALVDSIHAKGMYVLIDWVANHTSWDNTLTTTHPEWYIKNSSGSFVPPSGTNWTDVIQLDYSKQELRNYMINAMSFWVKDVGIDGFRCDAASYLPASFWTSAITELKKIKPDIFMLAEDDGTQYQTMGFNMSYAWGMYGFGSGILKRLAAGTATAADMDSYINSELNRFSSTHYRMYFTSNHDENSWYGTDTELFGSAAQTFAVLTGVINGMQLVYGGQEAGLSKRLGFFDKDEITWKDSPYARIYSTLWNLKKENKALWNGSNGGRYQRVSNSAAQKILSFTRKKDEDKIFAVFNLGSGFNGATITDTSFYGTFVDIFKGDTVSFSRSAVISLPGWGYNVYRQISNTVSVKDELKPASGFYLSMNYPNPFNPSTSISYSIPEKEFVELKVFDLLGREVASLISGEQQAGRYTVKFDGSNLTSGVYIYRLSAGKYIQSNKMTLMK